MNTTKEILKRITKLEELERAASDTGGVWMVRLDNTKLTIKSASQARVVLECETATPGEAVQIVESHILKKAPVHVNFSYHLDDIFDIYPEYLPILGEYAPIPVTNWTTGDYCKSLGDLSLRHIILYNHVLMYAQETGANRIMGICYEESDFECICDNEGLLFAVVLDVIRKQAHFYEHADRDDPENRHLFENPSLMKWGKMGALCT
jgi:hypothetical protein